MLEAAVEGKLKMVSESSVVSPTIVKSPLDKREYRGITLNNKMKVLLISDPLTDKAAASLSVAAGIKLISCFL